MVFGEVKIGAKGQRPLHHKHTPLFALGLDFDKDNGASSGRKGMKIPREGHDLNRKGPKVK
jgi:hypothetical protein